MKQKKERIDKVLVEKGLVESRMKAQALILAGLVYVNRQKVEKANKIISYSDEIFIKEKEKFVSRGGYKLEKAIHSFGVDVKNKVCLDIGASTGGFTDCLLQYGAKKVYAVDVGINQLHEKLRQNPGVILLEKTNARYLTSGHIPETIDIFTSDVSFISQTKVVPAVRQFSHEKTQGILLIKPQFELSKREVKNGVVREKNLHIQAIWRTVEKLQSSGFFTKKLDYSPILGARGNREFLILVELTSENTITYSDVVSVVEKSHSAFTGTGNKVSVDN